MRIVPPNMVSRSDYVAISSIPVFLSLTSKTKKTGMISLCRQSPGPCRKDSQ